jgi:hypothetical protein
VFGVVVPKDEAAYFSPFDCAEFVAWDLYQIIGKLYGCNDNDGNPKTADAWTNFFKRDVESGLMLKISVDDAKRIKGAILLRCTEGSRVGHIVLSGGDGTTSEAMSTAKGVCEGVVDGRRWDYGILIQDVAYHKAASVDGVEVVSPYAAPAFKIIRLTSPMTKDPRVIPLATRLKKLGYYKKGIDNIYGEGMFKAVTDFQIDKGMVVDGEAGKAVFEALGVTGINHDIR